ncbi:hypothetical protein [Streptomyces sp. NPDC005012]|uniref:hypothetical protein n=1 Tax=Streptomyces sp. NPDC005012 TaxID=3154558 RepID=UPI0033A0F28D
MARGLLFRFLWFVPAVVLVALQILGMEAPGASVPAGSASVSAERSSALAAGHAEHRTPGGGTGETVTLREGRGHDSEPSRLRGHDRLRTAPAPQVPHPVLAFPVRDHLAGPSVTERVTPASVSRAPKTPSLASLQVLRC